MTAELEPAVAALERELLGGERRFTRQQVAEQAGVDVDKARSLWRALGFADVDEHEVAFTERDVEALRTVHHLVESGVIDESAQIAVTRAMGQSLSRLAEWQVATIADVFSREQGLEAAEATDVARAMVPVMEGLIGYVWRRHLAASAGRAVTDERMEAIAPMAIGFADLVGFTALTRNVDEGGLAAVVEAFEAVAGDAVAESGGRVVKTVGDEVMFTAATADVGAEIAAAISERVGRLDSIPDVRVGVAHGPVLSRLGDVYGEPVNIASRLTSIARPGSVLVDREMATALEDNPRWSVRRVPPRPVRGYTLLHGYRLRRAEGPDATD